MERIEHNLIQGTPEWHAFRATHRGASEASVMLGLNKNVTRTELLQSKATGVSKEVSDFVQEKVFDKGHRLEALARPIAEEILCEELFPVTYSFGNLSASCDGLTMSRETAFEHKQWSVELAASIGRGELPDAHQPQCQQIMMCTGAKRVMFAVSDGTPEKFLYLFVYPDAAWQSRIIAGWKQFEEDLASYQYTEVKPTAVAAPVRQLPAVSIRVEGSISLISNLDAFGAELKAYIADLPVQPSTDQEFADCKAAIGKLQEAQDALDAGESAALAQVATFDEMRRTKALYWELARTTRLSLEKLVAAREQAIKVQIIQGGRDALVEHITKLNQRIGRPLMPTIPADFAGVAKNKRTIASLQNAVDTELARAKIAANEIADRIQINLKSLDALAADYTFLFNDLHALVHMNAEAFDGIVVKRVTTHRAAEAERIEAERAKIRAEEVERLRREELEKESARIAEQARIEAAAREKTAATIAKSDPSNDLAPALPAAGGYRADQRNAPTKQQPHGDLPAIRPVANGVATGAGLTNTIQRPTNVRIIQVVAREFGVSDEVAYGWLVECFSTTKQRAA